MMTLLAMLFGQPADLGWTVHPHANELLFVQPFPAAGKGAYFALRRGWSDFDHEVGIRPYVFAVHDGAVTDVWRGTALAYPLVAARLVDDGRLLCAIHRTDPFLHSDPANPERRLGVYRWTGFGFRSVDTADAIARCAYRSA